MELIEQPDKLSQARNRIQELEFCLRTVREKERDHASFLDCVIDNSPFAMWVADTHGTVIRTNRALRETLQLSDEQILGHYNVLKDNNLLEQGVMPQVRSVFQEQKNARFEISWKDTKIGDTHFEEGCDFWINVSMFPVVNEQGGLLYVVCQWVDITEQKQTEALLKQLNRELEQRVAQRTRKLEIASRELEDFAYSVSHDLKAPLRAIIGFSEIISRRYGADFNEQASRYFDHILNAGTHMDRLIEDLLQYCRLGRSAVNPIAIPLSEVFSELRTFFGGILQETNGRLEIPEEMPIVMGTATLVRQIFKNLIANSLSYTRPGVPPHVTISTRIQQRVIVSVQDNGIGIAAEYQEKVFKIFQRLHRVADHPGTGIGLALVKKASGLLGGHAWLESIPNAGTTFYVALPLYEQENAHGQTGSNTAG